MNNKLCTRVVACALAGSMASMASAEFTDTILQVNATAQELVDNGFTQIGTGPFISYPDPHCAAQGCFTLAGTSGVLPLKGFLEFQFQDFIYSKEFYNGLFGILDISYGSSGLTREILIDQINGEASITGISAMTPEEANNAQGTCSFDNWMPPELLDSLVFNWMPDPPPTSPGLSQVFRFAWNLQDLEWFNSGGISLGGAYGVPAPGALGLFAMSGLIPTRRRRR